jgi:hypothetical protein
MLDSLDPGLTKQLLRPRSIPSPVALPVRLPRSGIERSSARATFRALAAALEALLPGLRRPIADCRPGCAGLHGDSSVTWTIQAS